jgi:hypothetical protein
MYRKETGVGGQLGTSPRGNCLCCAALAACASRQSPTAMHHSVMMHPHS